ncbi:spindle pole body interacting protein [Vararia minispora EC-137]|uniref:Spindle pole body interacting protein n=1 Tax=Vararia minispora EC-137 TaxID=1314806 RepID=A0ACB8QTM5_9AGAM|nr:spindle pole body interacting protein [Vararia minispora EC-137]
MDDGADHCSFVLLAEFDIDKGAQLTYQFPQPLGTDEGLLANLMLPDGAEKQLEDWTIFFLNQTPFNTIEPVLALESVDAKASSDSGKPELLYVLNLVRTKHDRTVRRGAVVKAMAICTRHPFIQIFKPVLLLALDDYFNTPSQDCLARLFDAINSMDISGAPVLTRAEKLVMRSSERKDVFAEKFLPTRPPADHPSISRLTHKPTQSNGSFSSFDDGIISRTSQPTGRDRAGTEASVGSSGTSSSYGVPMPMPSQQSPSENSFSLGGSAVWVGDESGLMEQGAHGIASSNGSSAGTSSVNRGRRSTDASSTSSHGAYQRSNMHPSSSDPHLRTGSGFGKDTHFFQTAIDYKGHQLPIKMPLSTFPEEVGDYSLIQLVQTLSNPPAAVSGPLHPHLHTNGSLTHPIMILFNALVTGKRIVFLGYNRAAGQVCSYVLSACALGSGCGTVLRGFVNRAFPYANLTNRDDWEQIPAYIAGVTNPIFEATGNWDLLCDVGGGRMIISKDIYARYPATGSAAGVPPILSRTGTIRSEVSGEDDAGRRDKDFAGKADSPDNVFIDEIITAINYHFGEGLVRARFTEYVQRFVRLASRFEEDITGTTKIGFQSSPFAITPDAIRLGGGMFFNDDIVGARELQANAARIDGWRRTEFYTNLQQDFAHALSASPIQGFDLAHQIWRFRFAKNLSDTEVELIMRTLLDNVRSYDQVVELLALLPGHAGGLLPLSFGLFHQQESIRDLTVDLFTQLRMYPIGVQALQALNHFQRYAYVRQAHARERPHGTTHGHLSIPVPAPAPIYSRTNSNRSDLS